MAEVDELYEDVSAVYDANSTADHDLDIGQTPPDSEPEDADYLDQSNSTYNRSTSFNQTNDVFEHSVVATDESMVDLLAQSFEEDHESSTHDESLNSSSHTQASMETTSKVMSMINSVRNIPVQISENSSLLGNWWIQLVLTWSHLYTIIYIYKLKTVIHYFLFKKANMRC